MRWGPGTLRVGPAGRGGVEACVAGLKAGGHYTFRVRSNNGVGFGAFSAPTETYDTGATSAAFLGCCGHSPPLFSCFGHCRHVSCASHVHLAASVAKRAHKTQPL